ncbi:MAG: FAD-dependent oxidoreductase, partial [Persicimonas sp.]
NRLSPDQKERLEEAEIVDWFLSPTVQLPPGGPPKNHEPLLLNTVGSLRYRPEASTQIENMFLASDYVRTEVDLATMESANEAARRAVNGILGQEPAYFRPCEVFHLREPAIFEPFKIYDRMRFEQGLPHHNME